MNRPMKKVTLAMCLVLCSGVVCFGYSIYLYVDGVAGDSTQVNHVNWIVAESFSHTISRTDSGDADHGHVTIGKLLDKATPILNYRACAGVVSANVVIEFVDPQAQTVFYQVSLENATVMNCSSYTTTNNANTMDESVSFDYETISWSWTIAP